VEENLFKTASERLPFRKLALKFLFNKIASHIFVFSQLLFALRIVLVNV